MMIRGDRIEERMLALGLSQSSLARKVGISQQAIHKLITGASRSSGHIARLARELKTTAAYLEDETGDPTESPSPDSLLSVEECELVENFQKLAPADQAALLHVSRTMADRAVGARGSPRPQPTTDRPRPDKR